MHISPFAIMDVPDDYPSELDELMKVLLPPNGVRLRSTLLKGIPLRGTAGERNA